MFNARVYFKFLVLLIKRGSLRSRKFDYEFHRKTTLENIPAELLPSKHKQKKISTYHKLRSTLIKTPILGVVIANTAFLKNWKKHLVKLYIDDRTELAYLRIYKCASTSVLSGLLPRIQKQLSNQILTDGQIDSIAHYIEINKVDRRLIHYNYFTIVRNPMERAVSAYIDVLENGDYGNFLFSVFKKGMKFKEVLALLIDIPDHLRGPHFTSQSQIIKLSGNKNLRIFKLENTFELKEFLASIGISLPHTNKSSRPYQYLDYYDSESIDLVRTIYDCDFASFGYEEEYARLKSLIVSKELI